MSNIEQYIWGMTAGGEAIVVYTITNRSGASVKLCNIGASILAFNLLDNDAKPKEIITGFKDWKSFLRGFSSEDDFARRIWEGSVEGDRVVFGLYMESGETDTATTLRLEVSYTFNDDNELEVWTLVHADREMIVDLSALSHFNISEDVLSLQKSSSTQPETLLSEIKLTPEQTYMNSRRYRLK